MKAVLIVSIPLLDSYIEYDKQAASFHKQMFMPWSYRIAIMDQLSGRKWNWLWHTLRRSNEAAEEHLEKIWRKKYGQQV